MNYSVKLLKCLETLVAFQDADFDCTPQINEFLTQSDSGLYFNDFTPVMSVDNLSLLATDYENNPVNDFLTLPVWDAVTAYIIGDIVRNDIGVFKCIVANTNVSADLYAEEWQLKRYAPTLTGYLVRLRRAALNKVLLRVFEDKIISGLTRTVLKESFLFEGIGSPNNTEPKSGRFVGVELMLQPYEGLQLSIHNIGLQAAMPQTLDIYVYHRSQENPLLVVPITLDSSYKFQWTKLQSAIKLRANELNFSPNESYIIGYYEADLTGFAINKQYSAGTGCYFSHPCLMCGSRYEYDLFSIYKKYFAIVPVNIATPFLNANRTLPDLGNADQNLRRVTNVTYGLNFFFSVECFVDDFLCRNKNVIANAFALQVVVDLYDAILSKNRTNNVSSSLFDYVLLEKENEKESRGIYYQHKKAMKSFSFEIANQSKSPCLPCKTVAGVKYKAI